MRTEIKTQIEINASPKKIWEILTNFENYPNWNPFIKQLTGEVKVGSKIKVHIQPQEAKAMTFKPTILTYQTNEEISWLGALFFKGIFDGKHKFQLIENENGTTTFIQSEQFKGILVSLFAKQLHNNTKRGFEQMNQKLKELAE